MRKIYWHQITAVTLWEFNRFFKWKQELTSYAVMLSILFGIGLWQQHIADDKSIQHISVSDQIQLPENERFEINYFSAEDLKAQQKEVGKKLNAVIYIEDNKLVILVDKKDKWIDNFKSWVSQSAQTEKLIQAGISGEQLKQILNPYDFKLKVKGEEGVNDDKGKAALLTMILLMVGVFTAFGYAFASITTEKQQRVTEQLLSSMSAQTWMDGKICGITLLCLKSLLTTALSMFIFFQIMSIVDGSTSSISTIPLSQVLAFGLFLILGLLMWNSLLAGFAATIDDPNHSSRTILMLLPAVPIFLAYSLADAPQSITMQVLSYFPLTSFAAMPIRMAESMVPFGQIAFSIGILVITIYVFRKAAARLFNMGVVMYGKEPGINEMINALLNRMDRQT